MTKQEKVESPEELKKKLFQAALDRSIYHGRFLKMFGSLDALTEAEYHAYTALYELIQSAGLEDEYLMWKSIRKERGDDGDGDDE